MAFMSQERKKTLEPAIKKVLKKYGLKGRLGVRHHSTLVLNIFSGKIDFIGAANVKNREGYIDVNVYHYRDHYTGRALKFLEEVIPLMNVGNHDRSDIQTDYFDVGWYVDVNVGRWNAPYEYTP